ncbi:MAG TPA: hypothetical protein VE422_32510 [Terriglobia bacterium]|nr:hypothetical protein [Terriglobia bacterium]
MVPRSRNYLWGSGLALFVCVAAIIYVVPRTDVVIESLPERISDREFWKVISDFSETGGFFRSDNFVSNETTFQYVIPDLREKTKPGGVYLGVGPDQNFTYIAALRPKVAFIVDIRKQNMLEHLMYKALFELSENRAQFLSKLFSRPIPSGAEEKSTAELLSAFNSVESDSAQQTQNLKAIVDRLRDYHGFSLTGDDIRTLEYVYSAFVKAGPEIRYSFPSQYGWGRFPSYSQLMLETDEDGVSHSYMSSEENFQFVRQLESENRIVPVVGDFAGEKALKAVGRYLREHGATVTAFYTSNVEFYLFQTEDWKKFLNNVSELPVDNGSVFIRAYFNNLGLQFPNQVAGSRSVTLLDNMQGLLDAFDDGHIRSYPDVIKRSLAPGP